MSKHSRSRAAILQAVGIVPNTGLRQAKAITDQDYAAVPPPLNLRVHPAGNCLVWLWSINGDGYGAASFPDEERLAHRQAFIQSRRSQPDRNVLHLCHRPFCVQPSHLYDGSAKENSQDRQIRTSQGIRMDLFAAKSEIVQAVAKYRWSSLPRPGQEPLFIAPAQHACEFIAPAMDRLICPTCGSDNVSDSADGYFAGAPQPDGDGPNIANISRRSRSFRNLAEGVVVESNTTLDYSIPSARAERRRRDKAARKSPLRDRPIHLGSTHVKLGPGDSSHIHFNMEGIPITGPGALLLAATTVNPGDGSADHSQRQGGPVTPLPAS